MVPVEKLKRLACRLAAAAATGGRIARLWKAAVSCAVSAQVVPSA